MKIFFRFYWFVFFLLTDIIGALSMPYIDNIIALFQIQPKTSINSSALIILSYFAFMTIVGTIISIVIPFISKIKISYIKAESFITSNKERAIKVKCCIFNSDNRAYSLVGHSHSEKLYNFTIDKFKKNDKNGININIISDLTYTGHSDKIDSKSEIILDYEIKDYDCNKIYLFYRFSENILLFKKVKIDRPVIITK